MKKLIPALCMLLVSALLMGTSTYAWFSMNTTVTATGLQVQAKAEGGIVIAAYTLTSASAASDDNTAGFNDTLTDAVYTAPAANAYKSTDTMNLASALLFPTSTGNTTTWYHANSNDVNNYAATTAYKAMTTPALATDGVYYNGNGADAEHEYAAEAQYFLYNKFSVKATADGPYSLWIDAITVTGETNSAALNDSLRIAVKVGSESVAYFAPMYGTSEGGTLYFYNGSARTAGTPAKGTAPNVKVANNTITTTASDIQIWVYYEGEDENCKTINATNVDTMNITISFTSVDPTV